VGRANVDLDPCVADATGNDASSLAFPFPFLFPGELSSSLAPSALTNPMLVFGRLGGGTTSLSSASERVVRERPGVPIPTPVPVPVEPREKGKGLLFPCCDVEGRFEDDAGRGIFDGDEGGATLDSTPVLVDVGAVGPIAAAAVPTVVDGFPLTNILSDVCLNLPASRGGFETEVDLRVVGGGFDFEVTTPIDFGGRGLEATVVEGEDIASTPNEGPATVFVVATGTDKHC